MKPMQGTRLALRNGRISYRDRKRALARLFASPHPLHVKKWQRDDLYANAERDGGPKRAGILSR